MTEPIEYDVEAVAELEAALEAKIRRIAREEIASLAGLVLRRTQDDPERLEGDTARRIAEVWGEVLNDFSTDAEPGT